MSISKWADEPNATNPYHGTFFSHICWHICYHICSTKCKKADRRDHILPTSTYLKPQTEQATPPRRTLDWLVARGSGAAQGVHRMRQHSEKELHSTGLFGMMKVMSYTKWSHYLGHLQECQLESWLLQLSPSSLLMDPGHSALQLRHLSFCHLCEIPQWSSELLGQPGPPVPTIAVIWGVEEKRTSFNIFPVPNTLPFK